MFYYIFLPTTGFKLWTTGIGSDHSANWATTTTLNCYSSIFQLVTELKFPDYRHDLEPTDEENRRLDRQVESDNEKWLLTFQNEFKVWTKYNSKQIFRQKYLTAWFVMTSGKLGLEFWVLKIDPNIYWRHTKFPLVQEPM